MPHKRLGLPEDNARIIAALVCKSVRILFFDLTLVDIQIVLYSIVNTHKYLNKAV